MMSSTEWKAKFAPPGVGVFLHEQVLFYGLVGTFGLANERSVATVMRLLRKEKFRNHAEIGADIVKILGGDKVTINYRNRQKLINRCIFIVDNIRFEPELSETPIES